MSLQKMSLLGFSALAVGLLPTMASAQFGFDTAVNIPITADPERSVAGDWDQDGDLDLAVTSDSPDRISLFLNLGDGTFALPTNILLASSSSPHGLAAGDFDGNGFLDIAVTREDLDDVQIVLNQGLAVFTLGAAYSVGVRPIQVATLTLDGNTSLDLAVVNRDDDTVSVLLNSGTGTFGTATPYSTGTEPRDVVIADFDGNTGLDLAVAVHDAAALVLFSNDGNGVFAPGLTLSMGSVKPEGVAVADFDGNGLNDLVGSGGDGSSNVIRVFLQTSTGVFNGGTSYPTSGVDPGAVAVGDFDLDLDMDVVVSNQTTNDVAVIANNGNGTFAAASNFATDPGADHVIVGDFDGNGALDVVTTNDASISVLINQTDSAFTDLGFALAGTNGLPQMDGIGTLRDGTTARLTITNGLPVAPGFLIIGVSAINLPFAGGTLVPSPDVFLPIALDGAGGLVLEGVWPSGISAGVSLFFQTWLIDAGAVKGLAATNALEGLSQ